MGLGAEFFFDAQQLVVFGEAVGAREGAGFDLSGVGADGEVGDEAVVGFAAAVRDDGAVAVGEGEADSAEGFAEAADLVGFDEDGVGDLLLDAALKEGGVGHEEVVADELAARAELLGHDFPAFPVVFGAAVFDGDDGVVLHEFGVAGAEVGGAHFDAAALAQDVELAVGVVKFAGGDVEGEGDVAPGFVAGVADGGHDGVEDGFDAFEGGGVAAFITDGGALPAHAEDVAEGVEDFGAGADGFGHGRQTVRDDHEFLKVDGGVGVGSGVDDVHEGHGQHVGVDAAEVAVERQGAALGGGSGCGEGDGEDGVGAEARFVSGAVGGPHGGVDAELVEGVLADEGGGEFAADVLHGLQDAFAAVAAAVAVAQFVGFVFAGGGAARHGGAADEAVGEGDFGFEGGVAPRIQDFTAFDGCDA